MSRITPAERRALDAYSRHGTYKGAAHELGKSPRTVEEQLAKVRERLDVTTTMQAVRKILIDREPAA
jgi:DNA-binding CsgD family transcriptional regulator